MPQEYRWDAFRLDLDAYRLERDGTHVSLEPKAFNLLALMIARPGHLFSKQEIFDAVWPDTAVTDHALTRVVAQLRRALGDEAREARFIETVPTRGYRWIRPVECGAPPGPPEPPSEPERDNPSVAPRWPQAVPRLAAVLTAAAAVAFVVWTQRPASSAIETVGMSSGPKGWQAADSARPIQVTTHNGLDLGPAISPQGDALAYSSDRTGALEIYVRGIGGGASETPLTSDGGQNVHPAWSPDGRFIAYHSNRFGGLWIVPARGGTARQIARTGSRPAWSPDGRRIAFQSDEHTDVTPNAYGAQAGSTLWIADVDSGHAKQVTASGRPMGGHAAPAWSHDGRYVAFTVFEGGNDDGVWLLTVESGDTRALSTGSALYEVAFTPGDRSILAAGGEPFVIRLPFDPASGTVKGTRELIPVPGVAGVRGLSIDPGGRRLAFAGLALNSQIWAQPIDRDGHARAAAAPLTSDTSRRNSFAALSPDGAKIAYVSTRSGELPNVWVMDTDGRNRLQVTGDETSEAAPSWFPDGRHVAYASYRGETRGMFAVDITTRREALLFDLADAPASFRSSGRKGRLGEVQLSPSATRAVFSLLTRPDSRRVLYVTGVGTLNPRALTDGTRSIGYPAWSPDERRVAVEIKDGSSMQGGVIDLETGAVRQLTDERGQTWVRSWSPDGRKIAAAVLRSGVWSLRWIDAESGASGEITPPGPPRTYVRYPDWSRRNDLVVFERGELRGNIWMLPLQ